MSRHVYSREIIGRHRSHGSFLVGLGSQGVILGEGLLPRTRAVRTHRVRSLGRIMCTFGETARGHSTAEPQATQGVCDMAVVPASLQLSLTIAAYVPCSPR